jgi:hypothetical protein
MKVQKLISMTPETYKKAQGMDNFSLFVRDCLRGTQHLKLEAMRRRVKLLEEIILIGLDRGSQHPDFKEFAEDLKAFQNKVGNS